MYRIVPNGTALDKCPEMQGIPGEAGAMPLIAYKEERNRGRHPLPPPHTPTHPFRPLPPPSGPRRRVPGPRRPLRVPRRRPPPPPAEGRPGHAGDGRGWQGHAGDGRGMPGPPAASTRRASPAAPAVAGRGAEGWTGREGGEGPPDRVRGYGGEGGAESITYSRSDFCNKNPGATPTAPTRPHCTPANPQLGHEGNSRGHEGP